MNARHHVAALLAALFAVAGAHAHEGTQEFVNQTLSTRARAEVIAEFERARAAGELERRNYASYGTFERTTAASARSRAEALAEVEKARAEGVRLSQGERSGS